MLTGAGPVGFAKASGLTASTGAMMAAMSVGPLRRLIGQRLPSPGEGPSKQARESGYFDIRLLGFHPDHREDESKNLKVRVTGDRDNLAQLGRIIADEAVEVLTGTRGVAGTEIAFISDRTGSRELYVMAADGREQRPATRSRFLGGAA